MKAEISEKGTLIIRTENMTESFALNKWREKKIGCSIKFELELSKDIAFDPYPSPPPGRLLRESGAININITNPEKEWLKGSVYDIEYICNEIFKSAESNELLMYDKKTKTIFNSSANMNMWKIKPEIGDHIKYFYEKSFYGYPPILLSIFVNGMVAWLKD